MGKMRAAGYSKYEMPYFSASLYYYDTEYSRETPRGVLTILEKYGMFPPKKIYADKLTDDCYIEGEASKVKDIFLNAYVEKDVFQVEMISAARRNIAECWIVDWTFTFFKSSTRSGKVTFTPWNILKIKSTHGRMDDTKTYESYLLCIEELIEFLQPFYASVDDGANWVKLMHNKHKFTPGEIQEIFWGNYFGPEYCKIFELEQLLKMPASNIYQIGGGVFFTLTDHICDFNTKAAIKKRKEIKKHLKNSV